MLTNIINLLRTVTLFLFVVSSIYLYQSAVQGDPTSLVLLTAIAVMIIITFGVGVSVISIFLFVKWHQASFMLNAKENIGIMQKMQTVLNSQNTQLLKQVDSDVFNMAPPLTIEDGIYEDL